MTARPLGAGSVSAHTHPFTERTRLAAARERLRERVADHDRTETFPVADADGRTLAAAVTAARDVPHYARAAMDGYAVRAADTRGAGGRSPAVLDRLDAGADAVPPGGAVRVHTGSALPEGADAVVMVEHVEAVDGDLEVFDAVPAGENVAPVGEDVAAGAVLRDAGERIRPSDLGQFRSAGVDSVTVAERPTVAVIPTGEELVDADPGPGEVVETNALTVSRLVERWGGAPTYRDVVTDDREALRAAVERDLSHDLLVTTGGSSVGERDLVPAVVESLGEVVVHGVAIKPGHPVALGAVDGTPVLMLPGYPVSCIVNAVQFLRPALAWTAGTDPPEHPSVEARLAEKVRSEPGVRSFARVRLERRDGERVATGVRASGAGVLSTVTRADGWVAVPESREGIPAGETVTVERWEWSP
ncbi:MAG: gephyrin-like molybdotransferase Glp [Halobacteriaceae archaeon]